MLIESPSNPTVKLLRSLEQAKARKEHGLFLVEGVRAVEDGLRAGFWPAICLYNPDLLRRTDRGAQLLKQLLSHPHGREPRPEPVEAAPRALEAAAATQHPQGVVAAFRAIEWPEPAPPEGSAPLALVCDNVQDPGNLGTILRTAEAAGVTAVWISPQSADQYNPKVVRAAMGTHFRLPVFPADWGEIAEALQLLRVVARADLRDTDGGRASIRSDRLDSTRRAVISNEAHGASKEGLQVGRWWAGRHSDGGEHRVLNAATAAAVVLFEAARQRRSQDV